MSTNVVRNPLIAALLERLAADPRGASPRLIETHISWVLLAGERAYKIKKPLDLGFLDFSTLEKRRFFCEEELRLNRRLAPDYYLAVEPITGTPAGPEIGGSGEAIEYTVVMRRFPDDSLLDDGHPRAAWLDAFAVLMADFHQRVARAAPDSHYGRPDVVRRPMQENFRQLFSSPVAADSADLLEGPREWTDTEFERLRATIIQRRDAGFVRECHGDLHLGNMAWVDGKPLVFDCIEFNADLRWIDIISEIAFLVMDLHARRQPAFAARFLNAWLEAIGDYAGVALLRFYLVYRALVRAKVEAIRAAQSDTDAAGKADAHAAALRYIHLARAFRQPGKARLILTRGLSASGKTTLSRSLLERLGAIRIRSDVERKRLFGLRAEDSGATAIGEGIYSARASRLAYARLLELAGGLLRAGYPVIVDAAFLDAGQRAPFRELAGAVGAPWVILDFDASADTLRRRIQQRRGDASDADLKVLEHQLATRAPLHDNEMAHVLRIDTEQPFDADALARRIQSLYSSR